VGGRKKGREITDRAENVFCCEKTRNAMKQKTVPQGARSLGDAIEEPAIEAR